MLAFRKDILEAKLRPKVEIKFSIVIVLTITNTAKTWKSEGNTKYELPNQSLRQSMWLVDYLIHNRIKLWKIIWNKLIKKQSNVGNDKMHV